MSTISEEHWDVVAVGAGPAGLLGAARAAERGCRTLLLEKGRRAGVKILVSGGTRCNLTHDGDARSIVEAFGIRGRFLHSALAALGPAELVALVEAEGVPTKVEPGGKVFPVSDRAIDVQAALVRRLLASGCTLALEEPLVEVERLREGFRLTTSKRTLRANKLILATGGKSYPGCGTTGDGYRWAAALGHTIQAPRPALVPVTTAVPWIPPLAGITLGDVSVRVVESAKHAATRTSTLFDDVGRIAISSCNRVGHGADEAASKTRSTLAACRGSLLFTHFGLSGPVVLNVSRAISGHAAPQSLLVECDFLPSVREEEFDGLLARACAEAGGRQLATLLDRWLPRRLGETLLALCGVAAGQRAAELGRASRRRLVGCVKHLEIPVTGTRGFDKAEVTAGGVTLDEVDSRTLQSKCMPNLYIVGELLDLDGPIGGYNFQAAFSTGWLAGESA